MKTNVKKESKTKKTKTIKVGGQRNKAIENNKDM